MDVLKLLVDECITEEEEEEDKLYQELDDLLEGVDFEEPLSPEYISPSVNQNEGVEESNTVHISSQEVSNNLRSSLIFFIFSYKK